MWLFSSVPTFLKTGPEMNHARSPEEDLGCYFELDDASGLVHNSVYCFSGL